MRFPSSESGPRPRPTVHIADVSGYRCLADGEQVVEMRPVTELVLGYSREHISTL